ncbi:MAG: hypothetical protein IJ428_01205 [Clostridia bacterium]|nr:hypothetical protein [Clostridia bacterium]
MGRTSRDQRTKKNNVLLDHVELYRLKMFKKGVDKEEVAHLLGFNCSGTLYNRLENPNDFKLGELHEIASVLNINIGPLLGEKEAPD